MESNWQYVTIVADNGYASKEWQTIARFNVEKFMKPFLIRYVLVPFGTCDVNAFITRTEAEKGK